MIESVSGDRSSMIDAALPVGYGEGTWSPALFTNIVSKKSVFRNVAVMGLG
jgi:hypothetical protein